MRACELLSPRGTECSAITARPPATSSRLLETSSGSEATGGIADATSLESNRRMASLIARGACGVGQAVDPRTEHGHARFHVFGDVARDDREAMMLTSRSDDQIGLREGVPALAPLLDHEPPLEHDVFGDRERALLEHRADFVSEPVH